MALGIFPDMAASPRAATDAFPGPESFVFEDDAGLSLKGVGGENAAV